MHQHHVYSPGLMSQPAVSSADHLRQMRELCRLHLHRYVLVQTHDGAMVDGIIAEVDDHHLYLAVLPETMDAPSHSVPTAPISSATPGSYARDSEDGASGQEIEEEHSLSSEADQERLRQWYGYPFYPGYGYFGSPYGGFYGFPRRRFRRLVLPLAALTALTLLPYW